MPTVTYNIQSSKNDGLAISPSELESLFFLGVPIKDSNGNRMSEQDMAFNIRFAIEEIEGLLNIKLVRQVISESQSYNIGDYQQWGYIPTTYPVACPNKVVGFLGKVEQVTYPKSWLTSKKLNDGIGYHRNMYMIPTSSNSQTDQNTVVYSGIAPHMGHYGSQNIPYYWNISYVTSFDRIPEDILMAVGKLATINIFAQLGDIILGAGVASQSIGIDGLSQSINSTASATSSGYGARMINYYKDLKESLPRLERKYKGITFTAL